MMYLFVTWVVIAIVQAATIYVFAVAYRPREEREEREELSRFSTDKTVILYVLLVIIEISIILKYISDSISMG